MEVTRVMTPLNSLMSLDPFVAEFDRHSRRLLGDGSAVTATGTTMPMDVVRRGDELLVRLDLPGVASDSINVTVDGRVLTIEATRDSDEHDGDVVYLRGRPYGTVRRQVSLPDNLDVDQVQASYENGVLSVRIPVAEHAKPRRIEIGPGTASSKQITAGG
jgi:HSP20 family protein